METRALKEIRVKVGVVMGDRLRNAMTEMSVRKILAIRKPESVDIPITPLLVTMEMLVQRRMFVPVEFAFLEARSIATITTSVLMILVTLILVCVYIPTTMRLALTEMGVPWMIIANMELVKVELTKIVTITILVPMIPAITILENVCIIITRLLAKMIIFVP